VQHFTGPLVSEESYSAFGEGMAALKSSAALKTQNCYKFNAGTELNESFDVDYYETAFRNYDVQIGRFTGVDKMAEKTMHLTPYQFGGNDPIAYNDPTGLLLKRQDQLEDMYSATMEGGGWNSLGLLDDGGGFDISSSTSHLNRWHALEAFEGDFSQAWSTMKMGIKKGLNSEIGGNVSNDGSFTAFNSQKDAFASGVIQKYQGDLSKMTFNEVVALVKLQGSGSGGDNSGGGGTYVGLEKLDGANNSSSWLPTNLEYFATLLEEDGLIVGVTSATVQPQPAIIQEYGPKGVITTYNIVIVDPMFEVLTALPNIWVDIRWTFYLSVRTTITKNGKLRSSSTESNFWEHEKTFWVGD